MKKLLLSSLTLSLVMMSSLAQANDQLEDIMKGMKNKLSAVAKEIDHPEHNAASAKLSQELSDLVIEALPLVPDTVAALPEEQQKASLVRYQKMLNELLGLTRDLEATLLANKNDEAKDLLIKIKELKGLGHDEFKD
jgi:gas vesicle protein